MLRFKGKETNIIHMEPLLIFLLALILVLILTTYVRLHPFLSLVLASLCIGIMAGRPEEALSTISSGMGKVFSQFAIIITAGSILGIVLEKNGGMAIIASDLIKVSKRPLLALNMLGFIFAVPFMCSILAFVVFSPLAKDVSRRSNIPAGIAATSLVLGTLASFGLLYPSPAVISAATEMHVDIAKVFFMGLVIAFPISILGYRYATRSIKMKEHDYVLEATSLSKGSKSRASAYIPICLPILLILAGAFFTHPLIAFIGDPNVALLIGVLLCLVWSRSYGKELHEWIEKAIRRSGIVLLDLCGGGALGATFTMTGAGEALGKMFLDLALPTLLIPFLVAVAVQTVQGSRVVTMLVVPSLIMPIFPQLGLPAEISLLSMACGTFLVSHVNDPFFWIFRDLAELETGEALRYYTFGGILMGLAGLLLLGCVYVIMF
ncbi:GntP family permease [Methanomethylovorans sp.]|uniref:GntP family permease n=1 Tax=Methanomethylovorans sp. TaxID=2758717 RepID=UPI003D0AB6A1